MTAPLTLADFVSPSLGAAGVGPAFERKFLLDDLQARAVEDWARRHLIADPHGDPALGGAYRTTSLYFDTPERDVYRRSEDYRGHKYRVRCYGALAWVYLERKSREADRVAKRRTAVPISDLPLLARPAPPADWPGRWFHRQIRAGRLLPVCRVGYLRTAFAGTGANGPVRLTLDRHVHGRLTDGWEVGPVEDGRPLLPGRVILELKFRGPLPAPFAGLVEQVGLQPGTVSKYRHCQDAWHGLATGA